MFSAVSFYIPEDMYTLSCVPLESIVVFTSPFSAEIIKICKKKEGVDKDEMKMWSSDFFEEGCQCSFILSCLMVVWL
jgi:hypothetical protein